jgi:capsular exopolysaccharide synthesis family protein
MGSMLKVMQKLQGESHEGVDGPVASPDAGAPTTVRSAGPPCPAPSAAPRAPALDAGDARRSAASACPASSDSSSARRTAGAGAHRSADSGVGRDAGGSPARWNAGRLDQALVAVHDRYSAVSEQYRSLRARLVNMNAQNAHQVIAVTSSLPQEGKSVTTINLGIVMAEGNEHQVLIADADFRRASIARMLGVEAEPGLVELIRGRASLADVLRPTPLPNLKLITVGATVDKNYGELVGASATRAILAQLRERFDYTFLDTPPVNTVSDVSMLAPHCDGIMLVIAMRRTSEATVQEAVRTLQTTNVKILGCILSRHQNERGHYYERYYSYYNGD